VLVNRLWEQTKLRVFGNEGVASLYRPAGLLQFRLKIPLDPEQTLREEQKRMEATKSEVDSLQRTRIVPVGPEYD
jgi:hypothetical protein